MVTVSGLAEEQGGALEAELLGMAEDLEPKTQEEQDQEEQAAQSEANQQMSNQMLAFGIVSLLAKGASMRWECLQYPKELQMQGAEVLAPVLEKYSAADSFLGKIMANYPEECRAGVFFGGVIYTSYVKVQEYKKAQAADNDDEGAHFDGAT
jgi:hypothetical protein